MFPTISYLSDLLPAIDGNEQFRAQVQENGCTIVCYMLKDEDTFAGENSDLKAECRGITFAPDGTIASRTLHKFPNVGESEESSPANIPWDKIVRVMDKRDGSMITPVLIGDKIVCKTKKTFDSPEAKAATDFIYMDVNRVKWIKRILAAGYTPIFEWTSPRFPIVLIYSKDELSLLHIRNNITGEYVVDLDRDNHFIIDCAFPMVQNIISDFVMDGKFQGDLILKAATFTTGVEGWIIQAYDGQMWKIKTMWYVDLHHSVTFTRYRDVAKTVVADASDDLKAAFATTGRSIAPIVAIEHEVFGRIAEAQKQVHDILEEAKVEQLDAKAIALKHRAHPLFSQIMRIFRHGEVDWFEWYMKNCIDMHSLEVIPVES